ncbi:MAG: hypothetical protein MUC87_18705 [Bacteroidia bacterium]|jgi:hypothetical protein|nr:hypothetical protein [Bacteroidia bacterium]
MGILKRIFGSGTPESDKKAKRDIELVTSGQVTRIYPVLKPGDWIGIKAGAVYRLLAGTPENPRLVIAVGYDAPDNFVFLTHNDLKGRSMVEIFEEAYQNLDDVESVFETMNIDSELMLTASGNSFSSEKILSKAHLLKAHQLLQSDELLISIPRRTCMMIMPKQGSHNLLGKFAYLHHHIWKDDSYGHAPIINAFVLIKNGEIEAIRPLDNVQIDV